MAPTVAIRPDRSALKASEDDGGVILELFRNCVCGSTLLDFFSDRRDTGPAGLKRRERFGELMTFLTNSGLDVGIARAERLKVLRGGRVTYWPRKSRRAGSSRGYRLIGSPVAATLLIAP